MDDQLIVSYPTVTLCILSVLSCLFVCVSAYNSGAVTLKCCKCCRNNKERNNIQKQSSSSNTVMMTDIVFFMCLTDGIHATEMALNWLPTGLHGSLWHFWSPLACKILAIIGQFVCIQSPVWHLILAYNLGYLLCGGSLQSLNKQRKYYFMSVIIIPLIATIVPAIYKVYGKYNDSSFDFECWLKQDSWQLIWVGAILISLIVHYVVLFIAFIKWKNNSLLALLGYYKLIVIKLSRFVFVFTLVRVFPAIERIYVYKYGQAAVWLICAHHWSIALLGVSNGIVWIINQKTGQNMGLLDDNKNYENMEQTTSFNFTTNTSVQSTDNNDNISQDFRN
eukprot:234272_1